MLSSNVQSIDLLMDCMAWRFWTMRQPNGCSTPAPRSSAAKQWFEELAQTMKKKTSTWNHERVLFWHRPAIQIVFIQIHNIYWFFIWIVFITHVRIVCFCISRWNHTNPASDSSLNHQQHIWVWQQLEFYFSFFQTIIPCKSRSRVIPTRVQTIILHANLSKIFKYIRKKQNISFQMQVMIFSKCLHIKMLPNFLRTFICLLRNFNVV